MSSYQTLVHCSFRNFSDLSILLISIVLVSSGCCNRYQRLGGLNSEHLFLTALKGGSLRSRCEQGWVLAKAHFLPCRWSASHCVLMWEREAELWSPYPHVRALLPSWSLHPHDFTQAWWPPKGSAPSYHPSGDFNIRIAEEGHEHLICSTHLSIQLQAPGIQATPFCSLLKSACLALYLEHGRGL